MKTTDKQIAANRRNASKSTGPIAPAGKASAARNSLKHGLLAQEIVVDAGEGAESQEQFDALLVDLTHQFDPQGPLEELLVEKIAVSYWRLRRAHRYEVGLIRKKLDTATDEYYKPDPFDPDSSKESPNEVNAKIRQAEELRQQWEDDRKKLARMRQAGKDLKEIYDWEGNWDWLYEKAAEILDDVCDESPTNIRASLNQAGWTDNAIWQGHIDVCLEQIEAQKQTIQDLEKEKQKHEAALQVQKKLGCMPDGCDLERLLKYEGSIERQFYRAVDQLERLQRLRAGDNVPAPVNIDVAVDRKDTE